MERVFNWTPWESASRLPPGENIFKVQKRPFSHTEKKVQYTFPTLIKHKLKTIGPLRSLLSRLPPGDKTFSSFSKAHFPIRVLNPPEPFPTPIKHS